MDARIGQEVGQHLVPPGAVAGDRHRLVGPEDLGGDADDRAFHDDQPCAGAGWRSEALPSTDPRACSCGPRPRTFTRPPRDSWPRHSVHSFRTARPPTLGAGLANTPATTPAAGDEGAGMT